MVNHYHVLGLGNKASAEEIKATFKKLALKHHPDRNPNDLEAEERFKEINRAYQILSDPYKKHQHDLILMYRDRPVRPYRTTRQPFYYPPFSKQGHGSRGPKVYQYGWSYLKTQLASFTIVFIVAALVMGVKYSYEQYKVGEAIRLAEVREVFFQEAQGHFDSGRFEQALDIIMMLYQRNMMETSIRDYRDKFVSSILFTAENQFQKGTYDSALVNFSIVSDYQRVQNPKVFQKMAECNMALGNYGEAVKDLDMLLISDKENLKLNYQIGNIYLDILDQPASARPYFDKARKRVKQILVQTYGHAPELVMTPEGTPTIYFDVFFSRAKTLTRLNDYEEAIKDCNWSVFLKPDNAEAYYLRGQNYHGLDKDSKACKNWNEAVNRNHVMAREMQLLYCL